MTAPEFFRGFCEDISLEGKPDHYYFEHSRSSLDFSALFDETDPFDGHRKMFHWTERFRVVKNESGGVEGVRYFGSIVVLVKADLSLPIDVQQGQVYTDGRWYNNVRPMVEDGGVQALIAQYNNCLTEPIDLILNDAEEIYDDPRLEWAGDGIGFTYEAYIKN